MIYFCIPAHNEERTVGVVLWKLRQVMAELNRDYQIIVIDDASTDSTPAVLSPYIRVLPLTVIRNAQRRGYADSLELAIREAVRRAPYPKRDALIVLQADFTEDPDAASLLVKRIEAGADIVATETVLEAAAPRKFRWGHRALRWLVRGKEWAIGDPLSGLRAYRIITMKRALDARGGNRLLSWNGWGANVELISQTAPQSRRSDVVAVTLKQHRHQRASRFAFMETLREVRGAATAKPNARARALPSDGVIAAPLPIVIEQPAAREEIKRGRGRGRGRGEQSGRGRGEQRGRGREPARPAERGRERPAKPSRGPRPARAPQPAPATATATATATEVVPATAPATAPAKRRRRPRKRKHKRTQQTAAPAVQQTVEQTDASPDAAVDAGAPKKKSRGGRRGGRGRRRGHRPNGKTDSDTQGGNGAAPPPLASEGD
ncbi:MAG: glycosyltransferase family 2 protein [Gemmatimonadota bacterium]